MPLITQKQVIEELVLLEHQAQQDAEQRQQRRQAFLSDPDTQD